MFDPDTKPDRCFCELAPLYVLDLLDAFDRSWVETEADNSPELKAELTELQTAVSILSYAVPTLPIALPLKSRLFEHLELVLPDSEATRSAPIMSVTPESNPSNSQRGVRSKNLTRFWTGGVGALLICAMGLVSVDNYRLRQAVQINQSLMAALQQPNTFVYKLQGTRNASRASGNLVVDSHRNAVMIFAQNLPELPSTQRYRLWALPDGATQPTYCGQFNSDRRGMTARWSAPNIVCRQFSAQMLITTEDAAAPLKPSGVLVMKGLVQ